MMKTTDTFRLLLLTTAMLLTSLTVQAQDGLIRRNTTTTTTTTRTTRRTTTTRSQTQPVKPPKVTTGTISITSTPTDAAVKIDGEYMGTTPLTLRNRKAGTYSITVSNEGYDSHTRTITVTAGKTATCSISLKKKQQQQQQTVTQQPVQRHTFTTPTASSSQTFTVGGVTFKMIRVEGGTFTMGGTAEQGSDADDDEKVTHRVTLSTYYIGETEVTQALWEAVMGSNPSTWKGSSLPVDKVSWEDCQNFVRELNRMTGKSFRLPTEAEWEFAARGGNKTTGCKYSGSNAIDKVTWYDGNIGSGTHDVKTKSPNELGIYDMSGNVWEWCQDWYGSYSSSPQTNPTGASSCSYRVTRGGGWFNRAGDCRVSCRRNYMPSSRFNDLGLRLAQ